MNLSVDDNNLGEKAIRRISKAQWPCLEKINLRKLAITVGSNNVSSSGWSLIFKANWKQLKKFYLSKLVLKKMITAAKKTRT